MREQWKRFWPVLKLVLTAAILVAVGRQFARDLRHPELWQRSLHPGWLALSGALYLLGLGFSALFWYYLLRKLGQRPSGLAAVRAYYTGHLGKYVPGKAWALLLRVNLVRGPAVRLGVAASTSTFEVLATMAAGVLLAAVLLALLLPDTGAPLSWSGLQRLLTLSWSAETDPAALDRPALASVIDRKALVLLALLLLGVVGIPILPPVFNRLMERVSRPFRDRDAAPLPPMRARFLVEGLLLTAPGWVLLGASMWAAFQGVLQEPPPWSWPALGRYAGLMGVAYVAGFVLFVPGGLGVREWLLRAFLVLELEHRAVPGAGEVVLAVVVLRLVWTMAEVLIVAVVYWLPVAAAALAREETQP